MDKKDTKRFLSKIKIESLFDCWEWIAGKHTYGYGLIRINGRKYGAHRIMWEYVYGAIPKGLFVCHHCDNPSCVNPAHLWLGTPKDNVRDMFNKGRENNPGGEAHWKSKLTNREITLIRELASQGVMQKEIAIRFGVSPSHISNISHQKTRKNLDDW